MSIEARSIFFQLALDTNYRGKARWFVTKTVISPKAVYTVLASKGFTSARFATIKMRELEAVQVWEEFIEQFRNI